MSLIDYVLTREEAEKRDRAADCETLARFNNFSKIVDLASQLPEAFKKAEIKPHDPADLYRPLWRAKSPGRGWIIAKRDRSLAFISENGNPYIVELKNDRIRGFSEASFRDVARFLLNSSIDYETESGPMGLVEKDGKVYLGFRTMSVEEDLARLVNGYTPKILRSYTLPLN